MSLCKNTILKSDISSVPVKLKYSQITTCGGEKGIQFSRGLNGPLDFTSSIDDQVITYRSISQLYYKNYLTGSLLNSGSGWDPMWQSTAASGTFEYDNRYFPTESNAKISVLNIPRTLFGERISAYSYNFTNTDCTLVDDGNGNIIDSQNNNTHVGNILYAQGVVVITNQDYQNVFPQRPIVCDVSEIFDYTDTKIFNILKNANTGSGQFLTSSLNFFGSEDSYRFSIVTSSGFVQFDTAAPGNYYSYYTVNNTFNNGCSLISNVGLVNVNVVPVYSCNLAGSVVQNDCEMFGAVFFNSCDLAGTAVRVPFPSPSVSPSIAVSVSPSKTPSISRTPTRTPTVTTSPTQTPTVTPSITVSRTPTATVTPTRTPSNTPSLSPGASPSSTPTVTPSISISSTPASTPSATVTPSISITPSSTPSVTTTPSVTYTPNASPSLTPTVSPSVSISPTRTATPTVTPSISVSITPTVTPSISITTTRTPSVTPSVTPSISVSVTPSISITPTQTPTRTPTITPTATLTPTQTPTVTITPSVTPSPMNFYSITYTNNTNKKLTFQVGNNGGAYSTILNNTSYTVGSPMTGTIGTSAIVNANVNLSVESSVVISSATCNGVPASIGAGGTSAVTWTGVNGNITISYTTILNCARYANLGGSSVVVNYTDCNNNPVTGATIIAGSTFCALFGSVTIVSGASTISYAQQCY